MQQSNVCQTRVNFEIIFSVKENQEKTIFFNRKYFFSEDEFYKSEINRTNPLGMKGIMAEEFGVLIKTLWTGKHDWVYADKLRVCFRFNEKTNKSKFFFYSSFQRTTLQNDTKNLLETVNTTLKNC